MATTSDFNVGGISANVNAQQVNFADGTMQKSGKGLQVGVLSGIVPIFGGSATFVFPTPYVATASPVVLITARDGFDTSGAQWSVSVNGTAGNWTGFTINVSTTLFGGFNFAVFGQPN